MVQGKVVNEHDRSHRDASQGDPGRHASGPHADEQHADEQPAESRNPGKPPHLDESVRRVGAAGRATLDSAVDTGRALRKLFWADLAMARSASGRALAWFAVAIIFGGSAWLLTMATLIALLKAFGVSWLLSICLAALISLAVTGLATWRVSVFFEHAGMHATRRQLERLGIGDEGSKDDDTDAGDDHSGNAGTARAGSGQASSGQAPP